MTEIPSHLPKWMADHLRSYLETDGEKGHIWNGVATLLLTTTGRRSGEERILPLIYGKHDGDYIVVASRGGDPRHPAWYLNLEENPEVRVQVGAEKFAAHARTAKPAEKPKLWDLMIGIWPQYVDYQAKTDRQIPVVILEKR